jgi:hypothetical protein
MHCSRSGDRDTVSNDAFVWVEDREMNTGDGGDVVEPVGVLGWGSTFLAPCCFG